MYLNLYTTPILREICDKVSSIHSTVKIMMQVYKDFCRIVLDLRCNTAQIDADVGKLDEM